MKHLVDLAKSSAVRVGGRTVRATEAFERSDAESILDNDMSAQPGQDESSVAPRVTPLEVEAEDLQQGSVAHSK